MNCPICYQPTHPLFQKHGTWINACEACGHRCADLVPLSNHVEQVYSDQYFREGGDGYPDYLGEADILMDHGRYYGRLLARYTQPGRVLDVGAAAGFILKGLQAYGWQGYGIEPNSAMAEYARVQQGLQVAAGTLEQYQNDEPFDLVSMIQVVPHFYDVRQAFQAAAKVTRPGGFWLIETWNRDSLTARCLGQSWHEYSPPVFCTGFHPAACAKSSLSSA